MLVRKQEYFKVVHFLLLFYLVIYSFIFLISAYLQKEFDLPIHKTYNFCRRKITHQVFFITGSLYKAWTLSHQEIAIHKDYTANTVDPSSYKFTSQFNETIRFSCILPVLNSTTPT